ncbi:Thiol-disulfide oxidoreductase ResA [compost metagenome]
MKQSKLSLILLLLLSFLFIQWQNEKGFTITGHVTGFKDGTRVSLQLVENTEYILHAKIKNDAFTFKGTTPGNEPEKYILKIDNGEDLPSDYCSLFIGNEEVIIKADKKDFPYYVSIKGSKHQDDANKLNNLLAKHIEELDKISNDYFALSKEVRATDSIKELYNGKNGKFTEIDNQIEFIIMDFIRKNYNSYPALDYFVTLREKFDIKEVEQLYGKMDIQVKNGRYGITIKEYIQAQKEKEGNVVYNFEAQDKNGKMHKMHDYLNNDKYVLLEFSRPGCSWCKKAIPLLEAMAKEQKSKLEVVSLTTSKDQKSWKTINDDEKISYARLYDNDGKYSKANIHYGIKVTPTFILISPEGKIMKKIEGYDEKLRDSIYPILK